MQLWEEIEIERIEGEKLGIEKGEKKLGRLMEYLLRDNRTQDMKNAAGDENARRLLYQEYGLE